MNDLLEPKINGSSVNQKLPISRQQNIIIDETYVASCSSPEKSTKKFGIIKRITNMELVSSSSTITIGKEVANKSLGGVLPGRKFNDRLIKDFEATYYMPSKSFNTVFEIRGSIDGVKNQTNCLMTPSMDTLLSRKSSVNSVRFATFVGINEQNNIENKLTEQNYNSISCAVSQTNIPSSDLLYTRYSSSPMTTAVELNNDADLLEASIKRNDKYTVRRILDVYMHHFRIKPQALSDLLSLSPSAESEHNYHNNSISNFENSHQIKPPLPSIFFNILHLAVEHNSIDVLRICLKHGLSPNEPGTSLDKVNRLTEVSQSTSTFKPVRFPMTCGYCSERENKVQDGSKLVNQADKILRRMSSYQLEVEPVQLKSVNYSSYEYLVRAPPLFIAVVRCNHAAIEMLLTFGACANVQDQMGNTPLHLATARRQPCYECCFLLLKYHASSIVFNNQLQSPVSIITHIFTLKPLQVKQTRLHQHLIITKQASTIQQSTVTPSTFDSKQAQQPIVLNFSLTEIHAKLVSEIFKRLSLTTENSNVINTNTSTNKSGNNQDDSNIKSNTKSNSECSNVFTTEQRRNQLTRYLTSIGFNSMQWTTATTSGSLFQKYQNRLMSQKNQSTTTKIVNKQPSDPLTFKVNDLNKKKIKISHSLKSISFGESTSPLSSGGGVFKRGLSNLNNIRVSETSLNNNECTYNVGNSNTNGFKPALSINESFSSTTTITTPPRSTTNQHIKKFTSSLSKHSSEGSSKSAGFKESEHGLVRRSATKINQRRKLQNSDTNSYCRTNKLENLNRGYNEIRPISPGNQESSSNSLCDISKRQMGSNHLSNTLSKEEILLIKKYTNNGYKSASAVVKMPTLASEADEPATTTTCPSTTIVPGTRLINHISNTNQLKKMSAQQSINRLFMPTKLKKKINLNGNKNCSKVIQIGSGEKKSSRSQSLFKQISNESVVVSGNVNVNVTNTQKSKSSIFKKSASQLNRINETNFHKQKTYNQQIAADLRAEQYEKTFKSIFNDLEKYSWNIECLGYIMDQLHTHLNDLLDSISYSHAQQQSHYTQQLQKHIQLQQQQDSTTNQNLNSEQQANNTTNLVTIVPCNSLQANSTSSVNFNHLSNGTNNVNINCSIPTAVNSATTSSQGTNWQSHHIQNHVHQEIPSQPSVLLTVTSNNSCQQTAIPATSNFIQQQTQNNHLINKLQELLLTLIKTCCDDFTKSQNHQQPQPNFSKLNDRISLANLNSIKSKKFQLYTRKLLEIALEMLLKCQVPSVQYISLTTINRIFDIYVYHNLFYPGYYESCYIPLNKRRANRFNQKSLIETSILSSSDTTSVNGRLQMSTDSGQTVAMSSLPSSLKRSKNKNMCACEMPDVRRAKIHSPNTSSGGSGVKNTVRFSRKYNKERNSTIHEDPSGEEKLATGNGVATNPSQTVPTSEIKKQKSLRTMGRRLTSFIRIFSIANRHYRKTGDPSISSDTQSSSLTSSAICAKCNRRINENVLIRLEAKRMQMYIGEDIAEEETESKDFTTGILAGCGAAEQAVKTDEENVDTNDTLNSTQFYQNQPFKCLADSIEPRMLLMIINDRLESHKKVDINACTINNSNAGTGGINSEVGEEGLVENLSSASNATSSLNANCASSKGEMNSRIKCMPSARIINCQHHCVAILGTRLFAILCNEQAFQQKLISENREVCFNLIVDILYPNNDPHLLCLMLQALGLLAMHPECHDTMLKYDLPDTVMSLILPGDELFYTNQTTKYAKFVKHLAARVLVYLGLFAKVSNKVNLFDILELQPETIDLDRPQSFENNFIHHMAIGENMITSMWRLNMAAISIEKLLDNILREMKTESSNKIQFGYNGKSSENLAYNMSYLTTIVHPLIIIRLLEHRLFTPLLKKMVKPRMSTSNKRAQFQSSSVSSSIRMTPSASFQYESSTNTKPLAKLTEISCGPITENLNESPISNSFPNNQPACHDSAKTEIENEIETLTCQPVTITNTTNPISKTAIFKDLSKKFLRRVNSGNQNYYTNLKRNFKSKGKPDNADSASSIGNLFDDSSNNRTASNAASGVSVSPIGKWRKNSTAANISLEKLQPNLRYPNSDNLSITGNFSPLSSTEKATGHTSNSKFDIKEFEKKLINLPTFTISDENSYSFLPNSISSTSIATVIHTPEGNVNKSQQSQQMTQRKTNIQVRPQSESGLSITSNNKESLQQCTSPKLASLEHQLNPSSVITITSANKFLKASVSSEIVNINNQLEATTTEPTPLDATKTTTTTTTITTTTTLIKSKKKPEGRRSIILMPPAFRLPPAYSLNPKYESASAMSLMEFGERSNRRRSCGAMLYHHVEYKDNRIILSSDSRRRKSETGFGLTRKKNNITAGSYQKLMNVRKVSCQSGCSGYEVRMAEEEDSELGVMEKLGRTRNNRRRNSYSLNHIENLKATASLKVPGFEAEQSTRSLSALSSVSKSNLNLSAKSAIDMLRKSYSRLFRSRSRMGVSCQDLDNNKTNSSHQSHHTDQLVVNTNKFKYRTRSGSPFPKIKTQTNAVNTRRSSSINHHESHPEQIEPNMRKYSAKSSSLDKNHYHQTIPTLTIDQVNTNNSVTNSTNDIQMKKSHNNLLTISTHHDRNNSMKSLVSTNSAISGGFLPSPEAFNQSACSSYSQMQASGDQVSVPTPIGGIVALAAATINSSLSNTVPVKITVQSDAGTVMSYNDLNKSKPVLNSEIIEEVNRSESPTVKKHIEEAKTIVSPSSSAAASSGGGNVSKPGAEVLTLIATWIKNAPNDFLDTRVIEEIKNFFNQLDSLKSSFKPWTAKLKQALNLEEMENCKSEKEETIDNEDIVNQYQFMQMLIVNGKLPCTKDESITLAAIQLRIYELNYTKTIEELKQKKKAKRIIKNLEIQNANQENKRNQEFSPTPLQIEQPPDNLLLTSNLNEPLNLIVEQSESNSRIDLTEPVISTDRPPSLSRLATIDNESLQLRQKNQVVEDEINKLIRSMSENSKFVDKLMSSDLLLNLKQPKVTSSIFEAAFCYIKSFSCCSTQRSLRFLSLKKLVPPSYQGSQDIIKAIRDTKESLAKNDSFMNELKLKENYVKMCRNLNCFGSVLFTVKEIVVVEGVGPAVQFRKFKRLLAIKPNKISLIDYKTKALIRSERMTELKSWFSGDGYYNLKPAFLQSQNSNSGTTSTPTNGTNPSAPAQHPLMNFLSVFFRKNTTTSLDMEKLFVIEFRSCKWHLQIDNFHYLKSITCILLDQSLDMGIDSNPLMLDLTISEHFQNRHKLFSPISPQNSGFQNRNSSTNNKFQSATSNLHHHSSGFYTCKKKSATTQHSGSSTNNVINNNNTKKSGISNYSSGNNKSLCNERSKNDTSPSTSIIANPRSHSGIAIGANNPANDHSDNISDNGLFLKNSGSFSVFEYEEGGSGSRNLRPCLAKGFYSTKRSGIAYKYELEFKELQLILLWFPEEVAIRLTQVEYDLFKQVHPAEYLRHATLDMNNHKYGGGSNKPKTSSNQRFSAYKTPNERSNESSKSVQDLIVRYKEVSSWIKKLIQSQPSAEKRLAIILSAIRCSITCWNIGNFNSSREIWLGLKTALVNQSEDIPGMSFLNSAFDSSTFIRTNYNYMQNFAASTMVAGEFGKEKDGQFKEGNNSDTRNPIIDKPQSLEFTNSPDNPIKTTTTAVNSSINPTTQIQQASNTNFSSKSSFTHSHHHNSIHHSITSKTNEGRQVLLNHLASIAASVSAKRAYCSKTQIYCEAVSRALEIPTCQVVPFFGAFLHDLRFIIESVPSVVVTCNTSVQKPIEMVSKLNGEENYFTRICVGGLLNTRKLELAHMLLQDISMFHSHPVKLPDTGYMDNDRFIAASISNLVSGDRKSQMSQKYGNGGSSCSAKIYSKKSASEEAPSDQSKSHESPKPTSQAIPSPPLPEFDLEKYNDEVDSLNDLASFISYASRQPSNSFISIRDDFASSFREPLTDFLRPQHHVSYIPMHQNPQLDNHVLQAIQNGFTFVTVLNEQEPVTSTCLLNIRLEPNNSTLIWSKPAWDITNTWINQPVTASGLSKPSEKIETIIPLGTNLKSEFSNNPTEHTKKETEVTLSTEERLTEVLTQQSEVCNQQKLIAEKGRITKARASLINNSLLLSMDNPSMTFQNNQENFFKRRLITSLKLGSSSKNKNLQSRRKMKPNFKDSSGGKVSQDHTDKGFNNKATNMILSNSSSFNDDDELVMDPVDPNIAFSVSGLSRHYVLGEKFNVGDPGEGFLDLHCVKHIRQGCVDAHLLAILQQTAGKYAISEFNQMNVISIVYGTTFAENRSFYIIGLKNSISLFYKALQFLLNNLCTDPYTDHRHKWLRDLYLNLFYDNANKRFQAPTPMQALLAFGGRHFNFTTLDANFHTSLSNLITTCQAPNKLTASSALFTDSGIGIGCLKDDSDQPNMQRSSHISIKESSPSPQCQPEIIDSTSVQKRACSVPHSKPSSDIASFKSTPPILERFSKLKVLKQKSLIYEIFARSSSASFERQGSYDSSSNCIHSQSAVTGKLSFKNIKLNNSIFVPSTSSFNSSIISGQALTATGQLQYQHLINPVNKQILTPFKPPSLFSLSLNNNLSSIIVDPMINLSTNFNNNTTTCCSVVSTIKSARSGSSTTMTTNGKNLSRQSSGPTSSSVQKLCTDTTELLGSNNMVSEDGKNVYSCGNGQSTTNSQFLKKILFDTYMEYEEFEQLFKSFYIHMRKDLKEIFDRYAILVNSKNTNDQNVDKTWQSTRKLWKGLIYENYHQLQQKKSTLSNSCTEKPHVQTPNFTTETTSVNSDSDLISTFTRNNLAEELSVINSFSHFFNTTMPTTLISTNTLAANRNLHKALLFHLQNQIVSINNSRLFFDLLSSNSISPYSVNCSSDLLLLNYFSQVQASTSTSHTNTNSTSPNHEFYAITLKQLREFIENEQGERLKDEELEVLIQRHEPNPFYRSRTLFSFVGFAKYLLDKTNFGFEELQIDQTSFRPVVNVKPVDDLKRLSLTQKHINKLSSPILSHSVNRSTSNLSPDYDTEEANAVDNPSISENIDNYMNYPLSCYYIASSHNTYLTGHQLKGESSAEIYRTALKSGCRCVELDVWDGDDGWPVVYHGRTLTSKVSFRTVVEVINESAFVLSPYPVILSIENRCSVQQQVKMAQIFISVLGDKLVKTYLFDTDLTDEPLLPSPNQLKHKILIKNKKILKTIIQQQQQPLNGTIASGTNQIQLANQNPIHHSINANISNQRHHLSQTSKSSIRINKKISMDTESVITNNQNGDYLGEEGTINNQISTTTASTNSKSFGRKLRTIGSKFTITEPKLKKNVRNFIYKSKSLTDSAFHKLAANGSKMSMPNQSEISSQNIVGRTTGGSSVSSVIVMVKGDNNGNNEDKESVSESTTNSAAGLANETAIENGVFIRRMRKRTSIRNHSLDIRPVTRQYTARRDSSLDVLTCIQNSTSTDLNEIDSSTTHIPSLSKLNKPSNSVSINLPARQSLKIHQLNIMKQSQPSQPSQPPIPTTTTTTTLGQILSNSAAYNNFTSSGYYRKQLKLNTNGPQIAQELSDLVVYTQAVKFRGLNVFPANLTSFINQVKASTKTQASASQQVRAPPRLVPQPSISSSGTDGSKTDLINLKVNSQQATTSNSVTFDYMNLNTCSPYSHQVTSMNESKAKQVCKKRPLDVICHTETQLIRCYPNARRFDSSNFSPINFWSCGIQLVALNYQTVDSFQILNQALFEQNSNKGYVLKPQCLWDRQHVEYGRFNPFEKKKETEFINFHLKIISGQYLTDLASPFNSGNSDSVSTSGPGTTTSLSYNYRHQHRGSSVEVLQTTCTFIEVELIGIPCDCAKEKTKAFNKNALNPIWNEEFNFHVVFPELAFVKLSVMDNTNNHLLSQRVIPLKCLRAGYRHITLRNGQNQTLELSTIFIHSRQTVEYVQSTPSASLANTQGLNSSSSIGLMSMGAAGEFSKTQTKHKQFKLTVYGAVGASDEESGSVQVKVTQDTTVQQVIEQYLAKVNPSPRSDKKDYTIMQEVERTWTPSTDNNKTSNNSLGIVRKDSLNSIVRSNKSNYSLASIASYKQQRTKSLCVFYQNNIVNTVKATITSPRNSSSTSGVQGKKTPARDTRYLQNHEKILEAQNKWTGNGKFIIKEKTSFMMPPELGQNPPYLQPTNTPSSDSDHISEPSKLTTTASHTPLIHSTLILPKLPVFTSPPVTSVVMSQSFWYANRTPQSIKADKHIKEYFYHCMRNFDFPMRINYCWNFSISHQGLFKKTLERPYKFSKVCAKRAATVVGEKILLKRATSASRFDGTVVNAVREVKEIENGEDDKGEEIKTNIGIRVGKRTDGIEMFNVKKKFETVKLRTQRFFKNLPPFKKESVPSSSTSNAGTSLFGTGIRTTFTVKNLMTRRKKSAPEQETKKLFTDPVLANATTDDDHIEYSPMLDSDYMCYRQSAMGALTGTASTNVYYIYLTDSCCVEVTASQQNSTVQNILVQALRKIKAHEESTEYCLVEHIEQEQALTTSTTSNQPATSNNDPNLNKRIIVKTRILRSNESLFVLSHVWNQMKTEKRDGFKNAKIILTKKQLPVLHTSIRKPTGLLKHRFSLQQRSSSVRRESGGVATQTSGISKMNSLKPVMPTVCTSSELKQQKMLGTSIFKNRSSANRLVRQKSFDESFEAHPRTIMSNSTDKAQQNPSTQLSSVMVTSSNHKTAEEVITQEQEIKQKNSTNNETTTTVTTTTTTTIDEVKAVAVNRLRSNSEKSQSQRTPSVKSTDNKKFFEATVEMQTGETNEGDSSVKKAVRQSTIQRFFKMKI